MTAIYVLLVSLALVCAQNLQTNFDERGISLMSYNGVNLIALDGEGSPFQVGTYNLNGKEGWGPVGQNVAWDASTKTLTWTWNSNAQIPNFGAIVDVTFDNSTTNALRVTVVVTNNNTLPIDAIDFYVAGFRLPQIPFEWGYPQSYSQFHNNLDGPNIIHGNYGEGQIIIADMDATPKYMGFDSTQGGGSYYVRMGTYFDQAMGFLPPADPFNRSIAAGASATFGFTLYFAPNGSDYIPLVTKECANYAAAFPSTLTWTDKTPIGQAFMTQPTAGPNPNSTGNPRGYMFAKNIDVHTTDGLAAFQQAALQYANGTLQALKIVGATGVIVWDLEGQQYPQPDISYVGSPDLLPVMSPEMDSIADEFFKMFTSNGIKCGMTIRPQQILFNGTNGPVRYEFPGKQADLMITKMGYAYKRWGCNIFYVDSNGGPDNADSADYFKAVMEALPDILIIPENIATRYYAYTAPLASYLATYKPLHTPALAKAIWNNSFSLTAINDCPNQDLKNNPANPNQWQEFVTAVANGDILSFRGWYDDEPLNGQVTEIYKEAGVPVGPHENSPSGKMHIL